MYKGTKFEDILTRIKKWTWADNIMRRTDNK